MNAQSSPGAASADQDACDIVRDAIRSGSPLSEESVGHVAACAACSSFSSWASGSGAAGTSDRAPQWLEMSGVQAAVDEQINADTGVRARLRAMPTRARAGLVVGLAGFIPLYWLVASRRVDLSVYPTGRLLLDLTLLASPIVLLTVLTVRPVHRRQWPSWTAPVAVAVAIAAALSLTSMPAAHVDHPASLLGTGDDMVPRALACFTTGALSGLPLVAWIWMVSRRDRPLWKVGALGSMLAAAVGGLSVFFHCPLTSPLHLTLGHATVMLPFLVFALVGRRST